MVSSIGAMVSGIFSHNNSIFSAQQTTSQALSFEEMMSNGIISNSENSKSKTEFDSVAQAGSSSNSKESGSNSEMDLNNDGKVTADEVIKYLQMQMMDKMSEDLCSDEGASQMGQQSNGFKDALNNFKTKQAAGAYQAVQNTVVGMLAESFLV